MSRISRLDRSEVTPEMATLYDKAFALRGNVPNMFRVMAHRPEIFATMQAHFAAVLNTGTVSTKLKELIIVRTSQVNSTPYCLASHTILARGLGWTDDQLAHLADWSQRDDFTPAEKAALPRRPSRPRLLDRGNFPATRRVSDRSATRTPSPRPHHLAVSPQGDLSSHEIAVACRDLSRLSLRLRRHHRRFDASSLHCLEKVPRGVELRVRRAAFLFLGRDAGCRDHRRPKSKKLPDNAGRSGGHTQREPLP